MKEIEILIAPSEAFSEEIIRKKVASHLSVSDNRITGIVLKKRAIDARGRSVNYRLWLQCYVDEPLAEKPEFKSSFKNVKDAEPVHIIGAGPAGIFAALRCLDLGKKPIIVERGKDVKERRRDLAKINKEGILNPESNYCFGEGGAGTYSDGKLYTRSKKRGDIENVLNLFVEHGADADIKINNRPHIGTNKLPQIITSMRETILEHGGEVLFNSKLTDFVVTGGKLKAIVLNGNETVDVKNLILATGHSADDIYELFVKHNLKVESKPFALGLRVEHPQSYVDQTQYNCETRGEFLPPAYYSLSTQVQDRGVFSFCMCPGGIIAPCATAEDEIVVNGWSPSKRNNPFANSGIVVQVLPEDIPNFESNPLAARAFQKKIEQEAAIVGGGKQKAPAQLLKDFVRNRATLEPLSSSYIPGLTPTDLRVVLPSFIHTRLKEAFLDFGKKMRGFVNEEAVLVGVESRTSSPVRIVRNSETMQHPDLSNVYPCGEGAGYAGGIMSAAMDGWNIAQFAK